jgi:hypothetical protein
MSDITIQRELGVILTKLEQIEKHNEETRQDILTLKEQLNTFASKSLEHEREILDIKPVTEQFKSWKLIGTGVILTVGMLGTILGGILAYTSNGLVSLLKWMFN